MSSEFGVIDEFKIGEATYTIYEAECARCGRPIYRLGRACYSKLSALHFSHEIELDRVKEIAHELEESFHFPIDVQVRGLLDLIHALSTEDRHAFIFENEEYELVRIADSARRALNFFAKNHNITELSLEGSEPQNSFQAAYMLGYLASDREWITYHSQALFDGYNYQEAREKGATARKESRIRTVKKFRKIAIEVLAEIPDWSRESAFGKGIDDFSKEIRKRALDADKELFSTRGKPLSLRWFRREVENAKADDAFCKIT